MKIVVDTNRILAALIKESTTRTIVRDKSFEFITSDYTITEIQEHKEELKAKTNLTNAEFDAILAILFTHIKTIPKSDYENYIEKCKYEISDRMMCRSWLPLLLQRQLAFGRMTLISNNRKK